MSQKLINCFASGFYISFLPTAILKNRKNTGAGLLGSLESFVLYLFLVGKMSFLGQVFFLIGILCFSIYISEKANFGAPEDNPKIVIDEVIGFLVAVAFVPYNFWYAFWGLVLFRFFDTTKLAFIKKAESFAKNVSAENRRKYCLKGVEIVLDDVIAGVVANIILWCLILIKVI